MFFEYYIAHPLVVRLLSLLANLFHMLHLLHTFTIRILTPCDKSFLKVIIFNQIPKFVKLSFSILFYMIFTSLQTNARKNFHSQSASCNSSNNIDSILLLFYEISPNIKNISSFINIEIIVSPSR